MSRSMLGAIVSCLVLNTPTHARADDAEDKAAAIVEKWGGTVFRNDTRPGKPITAVRLTHLKVVDADLKELAGGFVTN